MITPLRHSIVSLTLSTFITLILLTSHLYAQGSGRVKGEVLDVTGAAVPLVKVVAENLVNGQKRQAQSDDTGRYTIVDLPIGTYTVTAERSGFQTQVRKGVVINVATTVTVDYTMPVGQLTEEVEVAALHIDSTGASTGGVMENRQIIELPINGRDYARFSLLVPGAVTRSNFIADLTFNGLHTVHNQFSIDGIDASRVDQPYMANGFERGARLLTGSLDTIAEFRVQTSGYNAEYGRAAGSSINIVTKSGGNQIHGTAFEFLRNDILDARNFFAAKKPPLRFNDFGGNIGGPIRKDRTFYFVNYEGSRQRIGITGTGTVPSALLRSRVLATSPALTPIIELMPSGTGPTGNPLVDTYTAVKVSQIREDTGSVRLDNNFSDKDTAYVRVNVNDSHVFGPLFGVFPAALGLQDFQNVPIRTTNVALHEEHIFSPRLVNEFLAGMQRWGSKIISDEPFPLTSLTGLTIVPGTRGRVRANNTSFQVGDTMSMTVGRHSLKWGANIYRIGANLGTIDTTSMTFASLTDFINNSIATAAVTVGSPGRGSRATQFGAFIQDTFQLGHSLTIDYGLRYDYETVPHEANDTAQTFDTRTQTLAPQGAPYFRANTRDFGPRLAIAWSPTSRIVVRTGYGVYWQSYPVGLGNGPNTNNIPGNTTLLRQQIPELSYPFTQFISRGIRPLPNVSGFDWIKRDIYAQQWSLSVEREITTNTIFKIAYVGSHGLNLFRILNINLFDPALGRRPNPNFANISISANTGQSVYHGLQTSLKRRFGAGLYFDAEYTYAHAIDDVGDQGLFTTSPQDVNNLKAERGNSSGDSRHNFAFNALYDLPIGEGHQFLGSASGLVGKVVSGWRLAALGLLRSGIATTVNIGVNTFGNGNFINQRPNAVAGVNPYPDHRTPDRWLNVSAFSLPASGTFGNLGRGTVFGPGFKQIDFSVLKDTKLGEKVNLQFRAEFFNVFNRANFDQPNTVFGTSNFGKIFNTFGRTIGLGTSRQIQFGLKLNF